MVVEETTAVVELVAAGLVVARAVETAVVAMAKGGAVGWAPVMEVVLKEGEEMAGGRALVVSAMVVVAAMAEVTEVAARAEARVVGLEMGFPVVARAAAAGTAEAPSVVVKVVAAMAAATMAVAVSVAA